MTIHPDQHVHLAHARPLGELRAELAACTGRPELARSPLYVDDRRLDDHHVVGRPPLLAGATLRTSPGPCPTPERALAAPAHLAVLTGPGTGDLLPLEVSAAPIMLPITLPIAVTCTDGVLLRVRSGRRGIRVAVRAHHARVSLTAPDGRAAGRPRGARPGRPAPPRRPLRGLLWLRPRWPRWQRWQKWRKWPVGHLLTIDSANRSETAPAITVELRERPVLAEWTGAAMLAALDAVAPPSAPRAPSPTAGERPSTGVLLAALVPAIGSIVLAVVLRNPLFAIMACTAPLMLLGPALARRRQAYRQPDPSLGFRRSWDSPWGQRTLRAGIPPADLLTAATACGTLPSLPLSPGVRGAGPATTPDLAVHTVSGDLPDGCLAVIGARGPASALAARMLVSLHATGGGQSVTVLCDPSRRPAWAWVRWLPGARVLTPEDLTHLDVTHPDLASGPGRLLLVDRCDLAALVARLGLWHAGHEHATLILVVDDVAAVPSWCSARAQIQPDAGPAGGVVWSAPGTADEATAFDGVDARWAEAYARRVAALHHRGRWTHLPGGAGADDAGDRGTGGPWTAGGSSRPRTPPGGPSSPARLPASASLVDAPGVTDVAQRWRENAQGPGSAARLRGEPTSGKEHLEARIGVGAGGTVVSIDLLRDGPHALVAGTTGSGKSELLQTLILTLALAYSPEELAVALVDYKGGASFGVCAHLPHVVGQVTDLDPGAAERALTGLQAELRRRERLFAAAGATDLATYRDRHHTGSRGQRGVSGDGGDGGDSRDNEPLPRLLIVVDEFRAMAEDHPSFIPGLVRIAAQGRSLGIHLVLATQRPGGAITADMRANISLRIALRVSSPAESRDVIDAPDAADIPADRPGRAVIRRGSGNPELLQAYHAAGQQAVAGPGVWHSPEQPLRTAHRAHPCAARSLTAGPRLADDGHHAPAAGDRDPPDPAGALVTRAAHAATSLQVRPPRVPWSPALPTDLRWDELPATAPEASTLVIGLADHPREQRHRPVGWPVAEGHLLVLGRAGSGRTTALRTLAHAGVASGRTVHLVGPADLTAGFAPGDSRVGTRVPRTDPRRVARLLTALTTGALPGAGAPAADRVRHVVVVDGVEDLLSELGGLHRGDGVDLFLSALRDGPAHGIVFALAGAVLPSSALAALVRHRLTFASSDKHDDAYLGIPAPLAGLGGMPGRAVLVTGEEPVLCQVARTASAPTSPPPGLAPGLAASLAVVRVEEVLFPVLPAGLQAPGPGLVLLGCGGDDAGPVWIAGARNMLVCGPHGSGRSATLAQLLATPTPTTSRGAGADADADAMVLGVVSRDAQLLDRARSLDVPVLGRLSPALAEQFVADVAGRLRSRPHQESSLRLVLDDLDAFALSCPAAAETLWALVEDAGSAQVTVVASSTTVAAAGAYRGALAELRAARFGVVLWPGVPGSSEIFGTDLAWHVEPGVHHPGRGVLVDGSSSTFVQVARSIALQAGDFS